MSQRFLRILCLVLLCAICLMLPLAGKAAQWTVPSGVTSLWFAPGVLEGLGLTLSADRPTAESPRFAGSAYRSVAPSLLRFRAPDGDFERFDSGSLYHDGGIVLLPDSHAEAVSLHSFELRVAPGPDDFDLLDVAGRHWLKVRDMHFTPVYANQELLLEASLHLSAAFAQRLGRAALEDVWIGEVSIRFPAVVPPELEASFAGDVSCEAGTDLPIDVAMTNVDDLSQTSREPGGRVALTQRTFLANVGEGDVIWGEAIEPAGSRRRVDEHPFLVHAMYRLEASGRLVQIGISDVKHTFYSVNTGVECDCLGANVLYPGCEDVYRSSTNEDPYWLAPREEVRAQDRSWVRAGSHFDQCNGGKDDPCDPEAPGENGLPKGVDEYRSHDGRAYHDDFEHRFVVPEPALQTPGVFFTEAWYLAAGDVNLFNSMAHYAVLPELEGDTWTFTEAGGVATGSILDEIPGASVSEPYDTEEGRLQVAVATRRTGGRIHYEYALMNFDFDRKIEVFEVPVAESASVTNTSSVGLGGDPANAWTASSSPGWVRFEAPEGGALAWGKLASFGFDIDATPLAGQVRLLPPAGGDPSSFSIDTLTPVPEPGAGCSGAAVIASLLWLARRRGSGAA